MPARLLPAGVRTLTGVSQNIEYAMSLLNSLDQDASRIKTSQSRAERLDALNAVRDMLETLQDRIEDLRHVSLS